MTIRARVASFSRESLTELAGFLLLVGGLSILSVALAMIVAGVALIAAGNLPQRRR